MFDPTKVEQPERATLVTWDFPQDCQRPRYCFTKEPKRVSDEERITQSSLEQENDLKICHILEGGKSRSFIKGETFESTQVKGDLQL